MGKGFSVGIRAWSDAGITKDMKVQRQVWKSLIGPPEALAEAGRVELAEESELSVCPRGS